ncbi:MAG: 4Fe-4S binding protein, partial [Thiovulaceae bacterium]|nr:4Fe-4S binding protein [Sulfurimonadaceae bacterium]
MDDSASISLYFLPLVFSLLYYLYRRSRNNQQNDLALKEAIRDKLVEPSSLHPSINSDKCVGCGSCVHACPENKVLGLIRGKVQLINPTLCIGHGCCKSACPMNAIELVFGTATRGVDIPHLGPNFETNMPGIFIAGELGGMGLIRNAITQGKQAVEELKRNLKSQQKSDYDLIIIGAGPAGIAASLAAKKDNLR